MSLKASFCPREQVQNNRKQQKQKKQCVTACSANCVHRRLLITLFLSTKLWVASDFQIGDSLAIVFRYFCTS